MAEPEITEQDALVEHLRKTVRDLRAGGLFACEVEDIVIQELMRDD